MYSVIHKNQNFEEIGESSKIENYFSEDDEDNLRLSTLVTKIPSQDVSNYIGKNGFLRSQIEAATYLIHMHIACCTYTCCNIGLSKEASVDFFSAFLDLWSNIFDSEMTASIILYIKGKCKGLEKRFRM